MIELNKHYILSEKEATMLSDISGSENNLSVKLPERIIELNRKNWSICLIDSITQELVGCFLLTDYPETKHGIL